MGINNITPHRTLGFNLLELTITTLILSLIVGAAVPNFAKALNRTYIATASNQLSTTLIGSRNHALSTGITVIICHAKDSSMQSCSEDRNRNTRWSNGVISYADLNEDNTLDEGDDILHTYQSHPSVIVVFNQSGRLRFFDDGSARSAGFYLCSSIITEERHVRLLYSGRSRTRANMSNEQRDTCLSKASV